MRCDCRFFDTCLATTEIDVSPAFYYPNTKIERLYTCTIHACLYGCQSPRFSLCCRWFSLANRVNAEADIKEGKLLMSLMYEPAKSTATDSTRSTRANSAAESFSGKSKAGAAAMVASTSVSASASAKADITEKILRHQESTVPMLPTSPSQQSRPASSSSVRHDDDRGVGMRHRSNSARRPSDAVIPSSVLPQAPSVPLTPAAVAVTTVSALHEPPITTAIAPSTDFYQSIAEFTERTTNTIGNFFYEIEGLNLSAGAKGAINGDWHDTTGSANVPTNAPGKAEATKSSMVDNAPVVGVGYMHIHVVSAFKSKVHDVSDGDHYVLACVEDSKREFKSKAVFGSATPIFNVRWTIKMEHYRAAVILYLVDAQTHRRIASCRFSCFSLMQRDADSHSRHWKDSPIERAPLRNVSDGEEMGYLNAQVAFEEDLQGLFLSENLHDAPSSPPELLSVQRLGTHIARFGAVIDLFNQWYAEYLFIMEWKDPMSTLVMFLAFLYFTLKVQAEYALSGVVFILVVLMTRSYLRRRNGQYIKHYVEYGVKATPKFEYKPIARLRVTVLGFRNAEGEGAGSQPHFSRPSMKLSYTPMAEVDGSTKAIGEAADSFTIGYFGNSLSGVGFSIPEASQGVSQLMSNMVGAEAVIRDSIIHSVYDPWPLDTLKSSVTEHGIPYVKSETPELSLVYPVLQPLTSKVTIGGVLSKPKFTESKSARERSRSSPPTLLDGSQIRTSSELEPLKPQQPSTTTATSTNPITISSVLLPWEHNESTVKISFIDDQHSSFGGPNEEFVAVPLKDIIHSCPHSVHTGDTVTYEMKKWYGVTKPTKVLAKVRVHQPSVRKLITISLTDSLFFLFICRRIHEGISTSSHTTPRALSTCPRRTGTLATRLQMPGPADKPRSSPLAHRCVCVPSSKFPAAPRW